MTSRFATRAQGPNLHRKDIILKLAEHGGLNQSRLMSYCGLNNVKHKGILDEMVAGQTAERA